MGSIIDVLKEIYIRFLVWLGAAPPSGYEHLLREKRPPSKPAAPPKQPEPKPAELPEPVEPIRPKPVEAPEPPEKVAEPPEPIVEEVVAPPPPKEEKEDLAPTDKDFEWLEAGEPAPPGEALPEAPPVADVEPETPPAVEAEPEAPPVAEETEKEEEVPEVPTQLPLEAVEEPVAEEAPAPAPAPTTGEMVFKYEVQRGDTLNGIAKRYGLTVAELLVANDIEDANRIYPGQKLVIPGYMLPAPELETEFKPVPRPAPEEIGDQFLYTVASGDTLNTIAKRYGITVRELIEANQLGEPVRIRAGQKLVIPGIFGHPDQQQAPSFETDPDFPPVGPVAAKRAAYLSYFAAGHDKTRQHILKLLDSTELNSVVIDVKSDFGWLSHDSQNPLAREIGADRQPIADFAQFVANLRANGTYTIARLVTFKDSPLARDRPELAVATKAGSLWYDSEQAHWTDPFQEDVWAYNIQIAVEAAHLGFNEIQFDFVRFPTASQAGMPHFSQVANKHSRVAAITSFLSAARGQLKPFGINVSARTFGYACWRKDDSTIGQEIERMADYLDILCPMLFPSTFGSGIPGYKFAVAHPYEIVYHSAKQAVARIEATGCKVRPWIQDFPDYRFDKRVYGRQEIQAQIKGCFDAGGVGYMAWSPKGHYTFDAFAPVRVKAAA